MDETLSFHFRHETMCFHDGTKIVIEGKLKTGYRFFQEREVGGLGRTGQDEIHR